MVPPANPALQVACNYLQQWLVQVGNAAGLYVEGFATPESAERVRSLPAGFEALLIQEDPVVAARLRTCFGDSGAHVVEAPFAEAISIIAERAERLPNALVCLDPPTPRHLTLDAIHALATLPSVDLWMRFPHEDLQKLVRFRSTPVADLPPYVHRIVEGYGRLLGDPRGSWLTEWRPVEAEQGSGAGAKTIARRFRRCLGSAAEGKVLKTMELDLPDTGSLHLACVASDPRRLLALNAAVEELELDGFVCWAGERFRREPPPPLAEALELFAVEAAPAAMRRQLDDTALAQVIAARFLGQRLSWGEVLRGLVDTDVLPDDPVRAIGALRRSGRAAYRTLRDMSAEVSFPAEPIPLVRKVRASAVVTETLGLP